VKRADTIVRSWRLQAVVGLIMCQWAIGDWGHGDRFVSFPEKRIIAAKNGCHTHRVKPQQPPHHPPPRIRQQVRDLTNAKARTHSMIRSAQDTWEESLCQAFACAGSVISFGSALGQAAENGISRRPAVWVRPYLARCALVNYTTSAPETMARAA